MKKKGHATERLEPNVFGEGMTEHLHRYAVAIELCKDKIVLDIASGEGYGSNLLAGVASKVVGVDISAKTIKAAKEKYASKRNNLEFMEGRAENIPTDKKMFDVVVSFETIEHHDKHQEMMNEIKRVLKPGGLLIISSPDKFFYSDRPGTKNPFHVKELYKNEFQDLLKNNFKNVGLYRQKAFFCSVIVHDDNSSSHKSAKFYEGNYSSVSVNNDIESVYLIGLASDAYFQPLELSLFKDYNFVKYMRKKFESSTRFQFGNFILNPIKFFKAKFAKKKGHS